MIKSLIYYSILILAFYLIFVKATVPFKDKISDRYRVRGETFLAARQYKLADTEWQKSLKYNSKNELTLADLKLTKEIKLDLKKGLSFFQKNNQEIAAKIITADQNYPQAKAALEAGLELIKENQPDIALIPLEKAIILDPNYPQAWQVLAANYQALAEICQKEADTICANHFQAKANTAQEKLQKLDPLSTVKTPPV